MEQILQLPSINRKVNYEKIILFLLLILTVSFDSKMMRTMQASGSSLESTMVLMQVTTLEVKDILNNKNFSRYW
jgi:hypothetical protein